MSDQPQQRVEAILAQLREVFDAALEWRIFASSTCRSWGASTRHPVTGDILEVWHGEGYGYEVHSRSHRSCQLSTLKAAAHGWAGTTMHHARRMALEVQGIDHPNRIDEHGHEVVKVPDSTALDIADAVDRAMRLRGGGQRRA